MRVIIIRGSSLRSGFRELTVMSRPKNSLVAFQPPARAALASAVAVALTSTAAYAQQRVPQADIVVTGEHRLPEPSSSKFTAPLIDTSKSVTVISQALIAETGSTTL